MKLAKLPAISLFVTLALLLALPLPSLAAQECSINTFFGNATVDGVATDGVNVTLTDLTNGAASLATTTSSGGLYLIESANLGVCAAVGDQIQMNASFGGSSASATVPYASQASTRVDMAMASPILSSVIVAPAAVTIPIGTIQQLTASPFDQDNNSIAANITWASNNSLVAAVNATGAVNAAASGTANITATAANGAISVTGTSAITVAAAADTTPPVLTLPGNITAEAASAAGATVTYAASANDGVDGAVPAACNPASGSTFTLGTTVVSCTASDAAANTATGTFNVTVQDTTAPAITMNGASLVGVGVGDAYIDAGATALDDVDGNLTASIITTSNVDTTVAGTYSVTYDVSDAAGNAATQQVRTVSVTEPDTTPPAITLLGNNPETVSQGADYIDAGATATDNVDGNLTASIIVSNLVDLSVAGNYTVTYGVADSSGNTATATRTVSVIAAPPVDLSLAASSANVAVGETFTVNINVQPTGVLSIDGVDAFVDFDPSVLQVVSIAKGADNTFSDELANTFDNALGQAGYSSGQLPAPGPAAPFTLATITFQAVAPASPASISFSSVLGRNTDISFGGVSVMGTLTGASVTVVTPPADTTAPNITLLGENPASATLGSPYTDAGATALDNVDGNLTAAIITTSTVNTDAEGSYTVTYNVSDAAGNAATATRTVNVVATPVVVGRVHVNPDNVTLIVGSTFLFTAEARDAGNQLISPTPAIIWSMKNDDTTVGNIDSNGLFTAIAPGNATVIATVGNVNGTADILVNPPDTTPPVITILGANPITVQLGELYVDSGATASDNVDGDVTASIIATSTVNTAIAGTYNVTYAVRDAAGNDAAPVTRVVIVNTPPVLATIPSRISNSAVAFTASATDADGDAISYLLVSAPAGAAINQATGEFTWTPVSDGVYMFDVQASDGKTIVTTPASITADLLPPTTWDDYGEEDGVWQNSNRIITLTPEHGISGPSWTKYCLGEMCDPANGTEYTVPVNISADGTTYFRYASRDAAGNLQPARERAVKIDRNSFTDNGVVVESDKIKKVNDTSGEVELEINTTANQSISLSIRKLASAPNTSSVGIPALNKYVEITSPALQGTMNGTMIKLHYTDADVAAAGIDEATLRLYFYNETTGAWERSPNSGVDALNNLVWASTDHFSTWGAFGSAASSAPAPSGGGGGSSFVTVNTGGSGGGGGSAAGSIVSTTKTETPSVSAPAQKAGPIEAPEAEKQANGETTPSASASPITGRAVSDTGKGRANPKAGAAIMIAIVAGGLLAAVIVRRFRKKAVR